MMSLGQEWKTTTSLNVFGMAPSGSHRPKQSEGEFAAVEGDRHEDANDVGDWGFRIRALGCGKFPFTANAATYILTDS
jgi:hypothetical protein